LEDAQTFAREDGGIGCHEQGFAKAGVSVCGVDNLLCVHAGDGDGERSFGELFPVRFFVSKIVRQCLIPTTDPAGSGFRVDC